MAKISDFKMIGDYGYLKIDRLVMDYDATNYQDLKVMLKAGKKLGVPFKSLERIHQRYNKLRRLAELKELIS